MTIPRRPAELAELPLLPHQRRWWELSTGPYREGTTPLVFLVHRLRGPLDVDAWLGAVGAVVDRHESLRTRFVDSGSGPVQVIDPPGGWQVERIYLTDLPADQREARARELLNERRADVIAVDGDRLVRSGLVRLAEDDHIWTMTMHHIISDGGSLAVINDELAALYAGDRELAELPVRWGDYVLWYTDVHQPELDEEREYWIDQLAGVPDLELDTDNRRPPRMGAPAAELTVTLAPELAAAVDELCRETKCTRFVVFLAAFQAVLAAHSGQHDFCVGVPILGIGRSSSELASLVGLFSNTLAMRADLSGDPAFRELLDHTKATVLDAFDHQDLAFAEVVEAVGAAPNPSRAQVFQVLFMFDEFDKPGGLELPGLRVEPFPLGMPKILHDLMLYVWSGPTGMGARFVYDTSILDAAAVTSLARGYERLLGAAVDRPDDRLSELSAAW